MIETDHSLAASDLAPAIRRLFDLSAVKIHRLQQRWDPADGTPVVTVAGQYNSRAWTEWTQGFQFGSAILQFDATGDSSFLELGRDATVRHMAPHVSHIGVHDHGFNNVSTYGNLLRLMNEGRIAEQAWERHFYELALKLSGAIQAARWTALGDDSGFIHSFNGPQSLFADTIRSLRALAIGHQLGHQLMGEGDRAISLLHRLWQHAETTATYNVWFGRGRDHYDVRGRSAHESIFNLNDGAYRCPSTQQGYSPFTTWTRALAWILLGYSEQLEFLATLDEAEFEPLGGRTAVLTLFERTARATADFYIEHTPTCGVPYWDTGAPGLARMGDFLERPADPYNVHEPVDSSAAAISAQGLLRLARYLGPGHEDCARYQQTGLTVARTLLEEPYLSADENHEGLLLHSIYHRPNGWDHIPAGSSIPHSESSMWGDYHARELALYILRLVEGAPYLKFHL